MQNYDWKFWLPYNRTIFFFFLILQIYSVLKRKSILLRTYEGRPVLNLKKVHFTIGYKFNNFRSIDYQLKTAMFQNLLHFLMKLAWRCYVWTSHYLLQFYLHQTSLVDSLKVKPKYKILVKRITKYITKMLYFFQSSE